jgi:hypothetical protein
MATYPLSIWVLSPTSWHENSALRPCPKGGSGSAQTAIEFPPMQAPASFNLDAVKKEIDEKIKAHEGD